MRRPVSTRVNPVWEPLTLRPIVNGTIESFQYSEALKKSGIKWTEENLDKWLTDTEKLVPNNDMAFHVEKPDERTEIIAYLKNSGK